MENLDEKILDIESTRKSLEEAVEKNQEKKKIILDFTDGVALEGIKQGRINILDERFEFEQREFFNKKIKSFVPKNFTVLSEDIAKLKYPSESRPRLILSNDTFDINQTFNPTKNTVTDSQLKNFKDAIKEILFKVQPGAKLIEDGVLEIHNTNIAYIDFISPALDMKIRNLSYMTALDGYALICTINYPDKQSDIWAPISRGLMHTLEVYGKGEKEV